MTVRIPTFLNKCETDPLVPRLPLYLVKACLTSETVHFCYQ